MKKTILSILILIISACSSNEQNNPKQDQSDNTLDEVVFDISKISSANLDLNEVSGPIVAGLEFGSVVSGATVTKKIILKNTSSSSLPVPITIADSSQGFKVKVNRCSSLLAPNKSCEITLEFSGRSKLDGSYVTTMEVADVPDNLALNLSATVTGNPAPNASLPTTVSSTLNSPFYQVGQVAGSIISRVLTITNNGPGYIPSVQFTIPPEYVVRLNRCGSLKVGQSCTITLAFKDSRNSVPPAVSSSAVLVSSSSNNIAVPQGVVLATNTPQSGLTNYDLLITYEPGSVHAVVNFEMSNGGFKSLADITSQINETRISGSSSTFTFQPVANAMVEFVINNAVFHSTPNVASGSLIFNENKNIYVRVTCVPPAVTDITNTSCVAPNLGPANLSFSLSQCHSYFGTLGSPSFDCFPGTGEGSSSSAPPLTGEWDISQYTYNPAITYAVVSNENECYLFGGSSSRHDMTLMDGSSVYQFDIPDSIYSGSSGLVFLALYESNTNGNSVDTVIACQEIGKIHDENPMISSSPFAQGISSMNNPSWCPSCVLPNPNQSPTVYEFSVIGGFDNTTTYSTSIGQVEYFRSFTANVGDMTIYGNSPVFSISSLLFSKTLVTPPLENISLGSHISLSWTSLFDSNNASNIFSQMMMYNGDDVLLIAPHRIISIETQGINAPTLFDSGDSLVISGYNIGAADSIWLRDMSTQNEIDITSYCPLAGPDRKDLLGYDTITCFTATPFYPVNFPGSGSHKIILKSSYFSESVSPQSIIPLL